MLKILLSGCNGRMGQAVSRLCAVNEDCTIVAGVDINTARLMDYPVYADLREFGGSADVIVDFSSTSSLSPLLDYAVSRELPLVLCTTGFSDEQDTEVCVAAKKIPIFKSANMSLGVSIMTALCKKAAAILGDTFDIEIIERHHNSKLDAPSGTAMNLCRELKSVLPYDAEAVFDRHDVRQKRAKNEIGLHALRGGTIVGEHTAVFAGHDEVIEISHSAASREVFASGALKAAQFLFGQDKPGLYDMTSLVAGI